MTTKTDADTNTDTKTKVTLTSRIRQLLRELRGGQNEIFRYDRDYRA